MTEAANAQQEQSPAVARELNARFGDVCHEQATVDGIPTFWIPPDRLVEVAAFLKREVPQPFSMLYDLSAIDERLRQHRPGQPAADFTAFYHLWSLERAEQVRLKVALFDDRLRVPTLTGLWPAANWYEREAFDMFGIDFDGHPNLFRILTPPNWQGHPLRKEHPARATEMEPFAMSDEFLEEQQEALRFVPEQWGMSRRTEHTDYMFLNLGPNHPSVHGVFRVALQLDGEEIVDAVPDIGYHHRAAEKMGERQSWHTFIPYTDRIDYLGGVMNNLPYVMAVERMAGIEVPERARVIRIMVSELFRIASHLVFYGTFAQDLGQLSPVFYMFSDRERAFSIVEAITGGRMHPSWFRIGGVTADLPQGWEAMLRDFLDDMPGRLDHYDDMVLKNGIIKRRTKGIGAYDTAEAIEWGVTGPGLRATGLGWDLRKERPYGGYDQFDFEVPVGSNGDCYDRCVVRVEEMRQSLRIIRQCVDNMPSGPVKAEHPQTTPPPRDATMHDIETLIQHFLNVSWGPVIPPSECSVSVEATKGLNSYYLVSDGNTASYRTRIRTPSFPHLQMIPLISRGLLVADLIAIIASIDFVMADVDR
ncbi:MAG: NADH-quinone oxidoreductase subunit C/D [Gammaproteobacteria bacterium]|nr:NADH-quinone oxidoreductase subunit C/D [Gammaproteobacteria bacterium]